MFSIDRMLLLAFKKSLNRQNYSSSGSNYPVKKSIPEVFTLFWHKVREIHSSQSEVLGEKEHYLYIETYKVNTWKYIVNQVTWPVLNYIMYCPLFFYATFWKTRG